VTVLAIDQGTSATKALVVDAGGNVLGRAEVAVDVRATPDGGVELDAEQMLAGVIAAGQAALADAGSPALKGVGLGNQGETVLAWHRDSGRPIGPAIVWQDRRAQPECDARSDAAGRLAELTGLELDPYFVAPKMSWLRRRVDPTATITTTDTWLLHRLCGAFVTDVATAGRSLLTDLDTGEWSSEACAVFDIDPATLPEVVGNAQPVGTTGAFGPTVPVTGLCVDQQAALFAEHCHTAGEAKCTYGTGAFLLANTGSVPTRSANGLVGCPAWRIGEQMRWCLDGQVYTVGAAVSWLIDVGIIQRADDLDRLGGSVGSSAGVTFVPALAGLAAPYWKPQARASLVGLSLGTDRAHIARAAVDGIAIQVALLASAAADDLGRPLTMLRVDGGLTRSELLLQTQADLLQLPVEVYPFPDATALGIASFALLGEGTSGFRPERRPEGAWRRVEPRIGADEAESRIAHWQAVVAATMDA
jgi:glycerol kinase